MEKLIQVNFFCHAGSGIGLGHLTRCISIWNELNNVNNLIIRFHIICDKPIPISNKKLIPKYIDINTEFNDNLTLDLKYEKQIFILDFNQNYINDNLINFFLSIKNTKIIIAVDSLLKYHEYVDYFFMPTFQFHKKFLNICNKKISWGWDHLLLNPKYDPVEKCFMNKKILILTGGSDSTNLGQTFPEKLDKNIEVNSEINWVVGPFSKQPILPNSQINNWKIHQSPKNLDDIFLNCNYSITIFGVSFFELLYYGIPTVVFSPYDDKDEKELAQIEKLGVALVAKNEDDAMFKLNVLMKDSKTSSLLSMNSKKLFKQSGSKTFLNILKNIILNKWQKVI